MASLQAFARLPLFIAGTYQRYITSVQAEWDSGQQRVDVLNEGLAGFTPGSGAVTITIGYAVPIGGLEYDDVSNVVDGTIVPIQLGVGAKSYAGNGVMTNTGISQNVGASVEGTVTWIGEFAALS